MKVYFDNAATTPLHPKVLEKMIPFLSENFGNASSVHSFGRTARVAIENAREVVADFINADPGEIYFTSGGTESNNFIINGISKAEFKERKKNILISSKAEHHSILDSLKILNEAPISCNFIEVDKNTIIKLDPFYKSINDQTSLVSLIHVNNETGSINPIHSIGEELKQKNIFFHTDAVQSVGKIPIDVKKLKVDALSGSAHKINGPKGTGFAFVKSGTPIDPLLIGGSQERNRRGGTENVAGIAGLAEAINIRKENMEEYYQHVSLLRNKFIDGLKAIDSHNIFINGGENTSPYILSITFNSEFYKNDSEAMLMFLDINGIAVSNGSACTSGTINISHVLLASGYKEQDALGTIRISFGWQNNFEEVDYALDVFKKFTAKFKK